MPRVFRLRGQPRSVIVFALSIFIGFVALQATQAKHPPTGTALGILIAVGLALCSGSGAFLLLTRVVVTDSTVEAYNWLNRVRFRISFADVTEYRQKSTWDWHLKVDKESYSLPSIDFDAFHRIVVAQAPKALKAKIWKTGQLPPPENFGPMRLFDSKGWLVEFGISAVVGALGIWLSNAAIGFIAVKSGTLIYELRDVAAFLSLDGEGICVTGHWREAHIAWSDVKAVFCVRHGGRRSFVVTSADESIFIPSHVAAELETMRKLFYSLPDRTLLVNFDDSTRRGYRRRKKKIQAARVFEPAADLQF